METKKVRCEHCGRTNRVPAVGDGKPKCGNCGKPLPWVVDAGDADFAEIAEKSPMFVLVDLWATWCGPCRMVSPALEQLAKEFAGEVKLVKVDIDQAPAVTQRFEVRAVPTLLLLKDGQVVSRQAGAAPVPALRTWLQNGMASASSTSGSA